MKRKLYVLMGAPASGKTTWLKENGLDKYAVSTDDIRMLYSAPVLNIDGTESISQEKDRKVWNTFYDIIEDRIIKGERTFVDATNTTRRYWNKYMELANRHNASVVCIDFSTSIQVDELLKRNAVRDPMKRVADEVIRKMCDNLTNMKWNRKIKRITPEEYLQSVENSSIKNLSTYENIYHIGDIHGSIEPLEKFLNDYYDEKSFYIFTGDYVDRGLNNAEVIEKMTELSHRKNVVVLEGNHEKHLYKWTKSEKSSSRIFERFTKPELEEKGVSRKRVASLFYRMRTKFRYTYDTAANIHNLDGSLISDIGESENIQMICTHGGIAALPEVFEKISSAQSISGIGNYDEDIDTVFSELNKDNNLYQVHGHRNTHNHPIIASEKSFNLDGGVEKGGNLRVLKLNKKGFFPLEFDNSIYSPAFKTQHKTFDNGEFLESLRTDKYIKEKKDREISSFNFNKKVFRKGLWDNQRIKARGLFIDTNTTEIAARGYDKFFNIEERDETSLKSLKETLKFPVKLYQKENGFLGLVGVRRKSGELLITSKGDTKGDHSQMFSDIFRDKLSYKKEFELYQFLDENNLSLAFEVIDPINDPHIIEYEEKTIVLLDAIYRQAEFKKVTFNELQTIGKRFGFKVKHWYETLENFEEFEEWYNEEMSDVKKELEGYILEDDVGFLTKIKLPYYSFWKWTRGQMGILNRRGIVTDAYSEDEKGKLITPGLFKIKEKYPDLLVGEDVIKLRKKLFEMGYDTNY